MKYVVLIQMEAQHLYLKLKVSKSLEVLLKEKFKRKLYHVRLITHNNVETTVRSLQNFYYGYATGHDIKPASVSVLEPASVIGLPAFGVISAGLAKQKFNRVKHK